MRNRTLLIFVGLGLAFSTTAGAQETVAVKSPISNIGELLDRIPNFGSLELPSFMPKGVFRLYCSPHFGDLLHRDFLRVPVGLRAKIRDDLEAHAELEGYFTHGLRDSAGYGLDRLRVGAKYEITSSVPERAGWSTGVDFETPLSRPPAELSDGHRHVLPYIAVSQTIIPDWRLLGYASLGADLLSHTALPANFGRNELHANALTLATGVARDWDGFNTSLTATCASSALISNETGCIFALRPAILIPLTRLDGKRTKLTLTLSARSVWGPDGHEFGVSANVHVEFLLRSNKDRK